jgi:hypothetical protein
MIPTTSGFEMLSRSALKKLRAFGVNATAAFSGTNLSFRRFLVFGGEFDANGDDLLVPSEEVEKLGKEEKNILVLIDSRVGGRFVKTQGQTECPLLPLTTLFADLLDLVAK